MAAPDDLISDVLHAARRAKVPVEVVYFGGSQPGTRRYLLPVQVRGRMFDARCLISDEVKTFRMDRVAFPAIDSAIDVYAAHDADGVVVPSPPTPAQVMRVRIDGPVVDAPGPAHTRTVVPSSPSARPPLSLYDRVVSMFVAWLVLSLAYRGGVHLFGWPTTGVATPLVATARRVQEVGAVVADLAYGALKWLGA